RRAHRDGAAVADFGAVSDFGATATEGARTGGLADALLEAAPTTRAPRSSGGTGPTWSSHGSGAGNSEPPATQTSTCGTFCQCMLPIPRASASARYFTFSGFSPINVAPYASTAT